jgi:hypothetical protein
MVDTGTCATIRILTEYKKGTTSSATTKERLYQLCWQGKAADILIDWVDRGLMLSRVQPMPTAEPKD